MQTIKNIVKITGGESVICDDYGKKIASPVIKIGIAYTLELDLRCDEYDENTGMLLPLPFDEVKDAQSFYFCIDGDWDHDTTPKLFTSNNISIYQSSDGRTIVRAILPNTLQQGLINAVAKKKSVNLMCEIAGYSANGDNIETIFSFDFDLSLRNRLYIEDGTIPDEVINDPEYLKRVEIIALIDEYLRSETPGPAGENFFDWVKRTQNFTGTEEELFELLKGEKGEKGKDGNDGKDGLSTYDLAVQKNGYKGTVQQFIADQKGETGDSAFEVAKSNGFEGDEKEWLQSLKGADGNGIDFDAFGGIDEKSLYDNEKAGFRFLASVNDDTARVNYVYLFTKNSDNAEDWSEPLIIKNYGSTAKYTVFDVKEPVIIERVLNHEYDYFEIDITKYPNVTVAAVTCEVLDGEETLPYGSTFGVKRIVKIKNKSIKIYFGANIPDWTRGYVYLTQLVAPENVGAMEITTGTMYYGYIKNSSLNGIGQITSDILNEAIAAGTIKSTGAKVLDKTAISNIPAGAFAVVIVPDSSELIAKKDDGFGGKVTFELNNAFDNSGANGAVIKLSDDFNYRAYGELKLSNTDIYVYVE